ncbi:hypothetical protein Tco_0522980 [Tanacetum coccineum]
MFIRARESFSSSECCFVTKKGASLLLTLELSTTNFYQLTVMRAKLWVYLVMTTVNLRMLLCHQKGCKSPLDIRTVNNQLLPTYRAACEALGLLGCGNCQPQSRSYGKPLIKARFVETKHKEDAKEFVETTLEDIYYWIREELDSAYERWDFDDFDWSNKADDAPVSLALMATNSEGNPEEDLKDYAIIDSGCSGTPLERMMSPASDLKILFPLENHLFGCKATEGFTYKDIQVDHFVWACRKGKQHRASCKKRESKWEKGLMDVLNLDLLTPIHAITSLSGKKTYAIQLRTRIAYERKGGEYSIAREKNHRWTKKSLKPRDEVGFEAMQEELLSNSSIQGVARMKQSDSFWHLHLSWALRLSDWDVKSAFLYGKHHRSMVMSNSSGFEDPVIQYRFTRPCQGTLWAASSSKSMKDRREIMLVQVYVDYIIFGIYKSLSGEDFENLMQKDFQDEFQWVKSLSFWGFKSSNSNGVYDWVVHVLMLSRQTYVCYVSVCKISKSLQRFLSTCRKRIFRRSNFRRMSISRQGRLVSWQCKETNNCGLVSSTEARILLAAASCCGQSTICIVERNPVFHQRPSIFRLTSLHASIVYEQKAHLCGQGFHTDGQQ